MLSDRPSSKTKHAAAFCTQTSSATAIRGKPANAELQLVESGHY